MNRWGIWGAALVIIVVVSVAFGWKSARGAKEAPHVPETYEVVDASGQRVGWYRVPLDADIFKEKDADLIWYGKRLLAETRRLLPDNAGSHMNCNSCHIAGGKVPLGAPYINTFQAYPKKMPRSGKMTSLVDRINGCFLRSMNGKALDPESREMKAMIAYMKWLGQGVPKGHKVKILNAGKIDTNLIPDPVRGEKLYVQHCASCHGLNGEGKLDNEGTIVFPPLWGDNSFNIGAGMARTFKAAPFTRDAMPMSVQRDGIWGQGRALTDQEAVDIAEYFTHKPRPDFPPKIHDWPNGKKPKDSRY